MLSLTPAPERAQKKPHAKRGVSLVWRFVKKTALDLIFPRFCYGCKKEGVILCSDCSEKLSYLIIAPSCFVCGKRIPALGKIPAGRTCRPCRKNTAIYAFFSPFFYSNAVVKELIHGLKYNGVKDIAEVLSDKLAASFNVFYPVRSQTDAAYYVPSLTKQTANGVYPTKLENAAILPIPLHSSRLRERGFNQSELIGSFLSEKLGIPILKTGLVKTISTKTQIELSWRERKENLKGAFSAPKPELIKDKCIILLDDVKTSGATIEEAAQVLKKAGARQIWAITVAH